MQRAVPRWGLRVIVGAGAVDLHGTVFGWLRLPLGLHERDGGAVPARAVRVCRGVGVQSVQRRAVRLDERTDQLQLHRAMSLLADVWRRLLQLCAGVAVAHPVDHNRRVQLSV